MSKNYVKIELILLHSDNVKLPSNTIKWLEKFSFAFHYHIKQNRDEDYQRLLRFINGSSTALVLGGGGAKGWFHVGLIKALAEKNIKIDAIAGVSAGALIGACYLFDPEFNQVVDNLEYLSFLQLKLPQPTLIQLGLYGGNHMSNLPWNDDTTEKEELPDWTTIFLKLGNKMIDKNIQYFPKTAALLKEMPNVGNVFFSQLGPQATINPHYGYLKGLLRYHLGIIIPENNLCHLEVDGITYYWKPGESVVFDDMFLHAAYNKSNHTRVVLFIDFFRPLPFPYDWLNRQFLYLVAKSKFMKTVIKKTNSF